MNHRINLEGQWGFTPENKQKTTIQVPGGGWLKQGFDCEAATYERYIDIPVAQAPCVYKIELGAVNHIAEYWIGENSDSLKKIHEEVTAFTPQLMDITPYVKPGKRYLLRIFVRAFKNGRPVAPHWAEWCECIARGIFRSAELLVYPEVYISDVFVRTSVEKKCLGYDIEVSNASDKTRTVMLKGNITSWNKDVWAYPSLPESSVTVKAGEKKKMTLGPIVWDLDESSFWWPNMPYREGYQTKLHNLTIQLFENGEPLHELSTRFGFRELRQVGDHFELNGIRIKFRGDNLQVANYDRIDNGGKGDAIDTLPGFLPPSTNNPGWPKAVDNFLRLNYNVQREHMGPWTPYMIDVCDELGLMLLGESACRWDGFDMDNGRGFHEVKCLKDIIQYHKNHPSIVRWSTKNETQCPDEAYHIELYDAVKSIDDTRPIYEDIIIANWNDFDVNLIFKTLKTRPDFTWIEHYLSKRENERPYFTTIQHNDTLIPLPDRPYGIGEADWMRGSTPAGLVWWAATIALLREQGAHDVRPYTLLSCWASCIPGVKNTDLFTEENRHPVYGENNLPDPFSHPSIRILQEACHPLLVMDREFWDINRKSDAFGHFPIASPTLKANEPANRELTIFNDELHGNEITLRWEIREGSPHNRVREKGEAAIFIAPGTFDRVSIKFGTPQFNTFIFLRMEIVKHGEVRFVSDNHSYEIIGGEDFRPDFNVEERKFL